MSLQHTNPGGSCGRDGRSGARGTFALQGMNGLNGICNINVPEVGKGDSIYEGSYDLCLLDVKIAPEKNDGIIEPGSRVLVSSIEIKNTGGMPTPTSRSVLVYIRPEAPQPPTQTGENWVISEGLNRFVQLPRALEAGDTAVVPCAPLLGTLITNNGATSAALKADAEHLAFSVAPIDPVVALSSHTNRHQRGEPFRVSTSLTIRAQMTPFGRDFANFVRPTPFLICYPVQMSDVACLPSIPPGGESLMKFSITNISLKDYGRDGEMGREVIVKITNDGGDVDPCELTFVPILNGVPLDPIVFSPTTPSTPLLFNQGRFMRTITLLPTRTTTELSGRLIFPQNVEPYTMAKLSVDLLLGEINNPLNVVPIQHHETSLRVSKVYKKTLRSATLLVTNQQTTQAEMKGWEELAQLIFGRVPADANYSGCVDIWDISQEGHFDLKHVLPSGKTLCDDWENSTIIILNNSFDNFAARTAGSPSSEPDDFALNYLNQDQLVGAVVSHGLHFCVVSPLVENSAAQRQHLANPQKGIDFTGSNAFESLRGLLNPFAVASSSFVVYGCPRDFVTAEINVNADGTPIPKWLAPWSGKPLPPIHEMSLDTSTSGLYTHVERIILVKRSKPFKSLRKVLLLAENLQKQLLRMHPHRRYAMSTCNASDLQPWATQVQYALPPKTQAAIRIRRLLDVSSLTARITLTGAPASPVDTLALTANAATVHSPAFIKSPQNVAAFLQSIPFSRRVVLYADALVAFSGSVSANDEWRAHVLRASLLADLACEQAMLRMKKRTHGLTEGSITLLSPRLTVLSQMNLSRLAVDSMGGKHLLDLLANFMAYMETQVAWYELILPGRRSRKVTKTSTALINRLVSRIFSNGPVAQKHLRAASTKVMKSWKADVASVRRLLKNGQSNQAINLKGCAFARVLQAGGVAGGKIEWREGAANSSTSISGSICTEFGILFTPESFLAGGPNGNGIARSPGANGRIGSGLGTITRNAEAAQIAQFGSVKKDNITRRVTANRRAMLDLSSHPPTAETDGDFASEFDLLPELQK